MFLPGVKVRSGSYSYTDDRQNPYPSVGLEFEVFRHRSPGVLIYVVECHRGVKFRRHNHRSLRTRMSAGSMRLRRFSKKHYQT